MHLHFAGVRGSLPSPGPQTARYGGNTTCVAVELGSEAVLILDAGSGIRALGNRLLGDQRDLYLIFTHVHWDHLQGFPFFKPIYMPDRHVRILVQSADWVEKIKATMDGGHYFPMSFEDLRSRAEFIVDRAAGVLSPLGVTLRTIRSNHPGLCYGFRIEVAGRSFVFLPDNELDAPTPHTSFEAFVEFVRGTDLLIHDCQYTAADMPAKRGWGHSLPEDVCRLAKAGSVGELQLFHHDPERDDRALDDLQSRSRDLLAATTIRCSAATEGTSISLVHADA